MKKLILITLLACSLIPIYANACDNPTAGMSKKIGGWYQYFLIPIVVKK